MIILVTGQPGAGKSALVVDMLANNPQFQNRPLFVGGIPELKIDHTPVPPVADWTELRTAPEDETISLAYFTFPPGAVIVLDEAQRIYRPRSAAAKVPPEVAAFETHRHTGVDFILLTQHPGLLDSNIRKLVGRYIHIAVTPFGRYTYEWTKCVDPDSKTERDIAARARYKPPKRVFSLYKSSEEHTKIKVKMPAYVYFLALAVLVLIGIVYSGYSSMSEKLEDPAAVASVADLDISAPFHSGGNSRSRDVEPMTREEYLKTLVARVPGQFHTAPRYDEITKPIDAPWPMACVLNHASNRCRCIDQQGNRYNAPEHTCRSIVQDGIFKDWQPQVTADGGAQRNGQQSPLANSPFDPSL